MANTERERLSPAEGELQQSAVVGLIATEENADIIPGAVLRARNAGYETLVLGPAADSEVLSQARQLDALTAVFEPATQSEPFDVTLRRAARDAGFPGVIHHTDPAQRIDYEQSEATLAESEEYLTTAVSASRDIGPTIVAGIPAYNEEVGIGSVVTQTWQYCDEVIVVDDGSSDATVEIASEAGATVIEHDTNRGKGAAVRTLFDHVADREYDAFVLLDGDGQHSAADIPSVLEPIVEGDADLVIGSRYVEGSGTDETPAYRRVGQRVLDTLTLTSSRVNSTDSQSGFRALSPAAVESMDIRSASFGVESEMISSAAGDELTITERPIDVRYEGIDGQTQNPLRHGLTVVTFILQLVRDRHPLLFFGLPGMVLLTVGTAYGIDGILVYRATGMFYPAKVLVAGFLSILGMLGLFVGLVLNRISNMISRLDE